MGKMKKHSERAHSKYSASGSERWFNCPGSVKISEGLPDVQTIYSEEGTKAHEVHEIYLNSLISSGKDPAVPEIDAPWEMKNLALKSAEFIMKQASLHKGSEVFAEKRVYLSFIDPEAFGTFDAAIVDYFGTLHIYDYKYGAGVPVSPRGNLQMIFYGLGFAHQYDWNFKKVRLWINQPRIKGYQGPVFWDMGIMVLKAYISLFRKAIENVKYYPDKFVEGDWCHWCKAKKICPLKQKKQIDNAREIFALHPVKI